MTTVAHVIELLVIIWAALFALLIWTLGKVGIRLGSRFWWGVLFDPRRRRPDTDDVEYRRHQRRVIKEGRAAMQRESRPL